MRLYAAAVCGGGPTNGAPHLPLSVFSPLTPLTPLPIPSLGFVFSATLAVVCLIQQGQLRSAAFLRGAEQLAMVLLHLAPCIMYVIDKICSSIYTLIHIYVTIYMYIHKTVCVCVCVCVCKILNVLYSMCVCVCTHTNARTHTHTWRWCFHLASYI